MVVRIRGRFQRPRVLEDCFGIVTFIYHFFDQSCFQLKGSQKYCLTMEMQGWEEAVSTLQIPGYFLLRRGKQQKLLVWIRLFNGTRGYLAELSWYQLPRGPELETPLCHQLLQMVVPLALPLTLGISLASNCYGPSSEYPDWATCVTKLTKPLHPQAEPLGLLGEAAKNGKNGKKQSADWSFT